MPLEDTSVDTVQEGCLSQRSNSSDKVSVSNSLESDSSASLICMLNASTEAIVNISNNADSTVDTDNKYNDEKLHKADDKNKDEQLCSVNTTDNNNIISNDDQSFNEAFNADESKPDENEVVKDASLLNDDELLELTDSQKDKIETLKCLLEKPLDVFSFQELAVDNDGFITGNLKPIIITVITHVFLTSLLLEILG